MEEKLDKLIEQMEFVCKFLGKPADPAPTLLGFGKAINADNLVTDISRALNGAKLQFVLGDGKVLDAHIADASSRNRERESGKGEIKVGDRVTIRGGSNVMVVGHIKHTGLGLSERIAYCYPTGNPQKVEIHLAALEKV